MIDMVISAPFAYPLTGSSGINWDYSKSALPSQESLNTQSEPHATLEKPELRTGFFQEGHYELHGPVKPYLPPKIIKTLERWAKRPISDKAAIKVMKDIAEITIDFYKVQEGKYIALGFDGRIVESADSSFDLLMKIQGRKFPINTFVWRVGSDVFAGWDV